MSPRLVVVGCGGQGREIAAIAALAQGGIESPADLAFIDDSPSVENLKFVQNLGHEFLGTTEHLSLLDESTRYLIGVADGLIRERLAHRAESSGLTATTLVHPDATVGPTCVLGPGTVLWAGARLSTNVALGRHVHVNQNATVGHDTVAHDFATINPAAAVSGTVMLGSRSLVGAGAVVLQGLTIGETAIVGAGACVTRSVPDNATAKGVPARWSR